MSDVAFKKLTKNELAKRLGFSARKLDMLVTRGELPVGQRVGRTLYWIEEVALRWEQRKFREQVRWAAQN